MVYSSGMEGYVFRIFPTIYLKYSRQPMVIWPGKPVFQLNEGYMPGVWHKACRVWSIAGQNW